MPPAVEEEEVVQPKKQDSPIQEAKPKTFSKPAFMMKASQKKDNNVSNEQASIVSENKPSPTLSTQKAPVEQKPLSFTEKYKLNNNQSQ